MEEIIPKLGDVVHSIAGRDKGRNYIVMKIAEPYIWTCDGDLHKVEKFKKKKVKHTKIAGSNSEFIRNKLEGGDKITNSEVRRAIAECEDKEGSCDDA